MAPKYLIDTNIFIEILLAREKRESCKQFLYSNKNLLALSDFSLHAIGIILFKYGKHDVFKKFLEDVMRIVSLVSLPLDRYSLVAEFSREKNLDFDDAYQCAVASYHDLIIVTMDRHFDRVRDRCSVVFISKVTLLILSLILEFFVYRSILSLLHI